MDLHIQKKLQQNSHARLESRDLATVWSLLCSQLVYAALDRTVHTLTQGLAICKRSRINGRWCLSLQLMKDLLVQAEVNVVVEDNEVITVLGQLTYWADEDGGFIITRLRRVSVHSCVVAIDRQSQLNRPVSQVVLVLCRTGAFWLQFLAVLCALVWFLRTITETLVYVSVENSQISGLHPSETHWTGEATTTWHGHMGINRTVILCLIWDCAVRTAVNFCWWRHTLLSRCAGRTNHRAVLLLHACIHCQELQSSCMCPLKEGLLGFFTGLCPLWPPLLSPSRNLLWSLAHLQSRKTSKMAVFVWDTEVVFFLKLLMHCLGDVTCVRLSWLKKANNALLQGPFVVHTDEGRDSNTYKQTKKLIIWRKA